MYRSYEEKALVIARRMIYAFYVDRDIETILSYLNPENFIYTCTNTNETITGIHNMRDFLYNSLNYIEGYKIIKENYQICGSSIDSCLVAADIETQLTKYQMPYSATVKFLFQFKLVTEKLLVSYYQVQIPLKISNQHNSLFFPQDKSPIELQIDRQYHYEMFSKLMDSNATSMKVVQYAENLPYYYVNLKYLNLLKCPCVKDFVAENKNSIEHIYPADQRRYSDFVKNHVQQSLKNSHPGKIWQWQSYYFIVYRIFNREDFYVLEWGNLFTLNSTSMIMAIVLPLQDISIFYSMLDQKSIQGGGGIPRPDDLFNNVGIRIGKNVILYQLKRQVNVDGELIDFTPTEFEVLLNFIDNLNKPLTLDKIYEMIWNDSELQLTSNTLRMHISNIRRKLKISEQSSIHLDTIPNEGYKFWIETE